MSAAERALGREPGRDESGVFSILAAQHASRCSERRSAERQRIHARVVHPIDAPRQVRDPLKRPSTGLLSAVAAVRLLIAAGIIHLAMLAFFFLANHLIGDQSRFTPPERVKVQILEPPPLEELPEVEELAPVEGPAEPDFAPEEPEPPAPPAKRGEPTPEPQPEALPPDEPPPEAPVPHRIVGLSMESTVQGSGGPAFATGTTRMGTTSRTAVDPARASQLPTGTSDGPSQAGTQAAPIQRAASRIPTRDTLFVKPKRTRLNKPDYPPMLKAQGVEGTVMVSVDIAVDGRVQHVKVVRGSGHAAFDQAAAAAARAERFSPATRDGKPVAFTLSYSYRFRIQDR